MDDFVRVARSEQVKERFGFALKTGRLKIALFRHQGRVYALRDSCPHQAAPISGGYIHENHVVCPHHGWKFAVEDGAFINNERVKIRTFPVKEEGGYIWVDVSGTGRPDEQLK